MNHDLRRQLIILAITIVVTVIVTLVGSSIANRVSTSSRLTALEHDVVSNRDNWLRVERRLEQLGLKMDSMLSLLMGPDQ